MRLQHHDADIRTPEGLKRFMASKDERAGNYAKEREVAAALNRTVLPGLMDAYRAGGEAEREEIRALLRQCPKVRWSLNTREANEALAADEELRRRFALFAMKDGVTADWRDEIVALDSLCAAARAAALDGAALLRWAAALSSAAPRGERPSTRAVLLERADKVARREP